MKPYRGPANDARHRRRGHWVAPSRSDKLGSEAVRGRTSLQEGQAVLAANDFCVIAFAGVMRRPLGWPDVGVITEDYAKFTEPLHAGANHAEPGVGDLRLEIAMVPREPRSLGKAARRVEHRRADCGFAGCRQKIIGIGEEDEVGRAVGVGGDHVQEG